MALQLHAQNSPVVPSIDDSVLLMKSIYMIFAKYGWLLPAIFGVPGNLISVVVTTRKHNRHLSPCTYMTAMAVADTLVLFSPCILHSFVFWGFVEIVVAREFLFQFFWYLSYTSGILSGLFLMEMSVDRLIAIAIPMAARRLCTTSRAVKTVSVTTVVITGVNLHMFFVHRLMKDEESGSEVVKAYFPSAPIVESLSSSWQLFFGTILPFFVILACNIAIIVTLKRASVERTRLESISTEKAGNLEKDTQFLARMLILVSIAYVVLSIPYRMAMLVMDIPEVAAMYKMDEPYWSTRYSLLQYFFVDVWFCNYAVNFYLYCIGGGRRYRNDAMVVLAMVFPCLRRQTDQK